MMLHAYDQSWNSLNKQLRKKEAVEGGLQAALSALQDHQREIGFINDGLQDVERFVFEDPAAAGRFFRVQYNPRRALRFAGAGRAVAPEGVVPVNDGCFLCRENIRWQQAGRQFGYDLELAGKAFIAWMNPFPLLPCHVVVASAEHLSQEWIFGPAGMRGGGELVAAFLDFADRLPGAIGYFNGIGSGASIPGHLHFHFCSRPDDGRQFPLEIACRASGEEDGNAQIIENYPVNGVFWRGSRDDVFERSFIWIRRWTERNAGRLDHLTANLIASKDAESGDIQLCFVPRARPGPHSDDTANHIGGLEILGEFVFSTPVEKTMLDEGKVNHTVIGEWLARVRTPLYEA